MGNRYQTTPWIRHVSTSCVALALTATATSALAGDPTSGFLKNRSIGYALTGARWALLQTPDGKTECPTGYNEGPREQFKALYPNGGTVEQTQLERESIARYPNDSNKQAGFTYHEATGERSLGLNLDGKVGPHDFKSETGEAGVDNQLFRAIGCTRLFRAPDGTFAHFTNMWVRELAYNRILVELTNVDSLIDDGAVDVTLYRGLDRLMTDATGLNIMPGGSNRIDDRFGARFTHHLKGRIDKGVLTTEPADVNWPWAVFLGRPGNYEMRGLRLNVKLMPEKGEGVIGGYADVESWYAQLVRSWSTHHSSYGGLSQPSLYPVLHKLADGYPDEKGAMTAISSALTVQMVQVFIDHPDQVVDARDGSSRAKR